MPVRTSQLHVMLSPDERARLRAAAEAARLPESTWSRLILLHQLDLASVAQIQGAVR